MLRENLHIGLTNPVCMFLTYERVHLPKRKCHAEPAAAAKHLGFGGTTRPQTLRATQGDTQKLARRASKHQSPPYNKYQVILGIALK